MAAMLAEYIKDGDLKALQQEIKVSCMCRVKSEVGFGEKYKPQLVKQNPSRIDNLSYCFAIVTPDKTKAEKYAVELAQISAYMGRLSDQDFFTYFNREHYILMHQNFMAFMSWWNHENLMEKLITNIIQISVDAAPSNEIKNWWTTKEFAKYLFNKFGAVHCSSAFDMVKERKKSQFVA